MYSALATQHTFRPRLLVVSDTASLVSAAVLMRKLPMHGTATNGPGSLRWQ